MKTSTQMLIFIFVIIPLQMLTMSGIPTLLYKMGHTVLADLFLLLATFFVGFLFWLVFRVKKESDEK